jgi:hypothetical protein
LLPGDLAQDLVSQPDPDAEALGEDAAGMLDDSGWIRLWHGG